MTYRELKELLDGLDEKHLDQGVALLDPNSGVYEAERVRLDIKLYHSRSRCWYHLSRTDPNCSANKQMTGPRPFMTLSWE